MEGNCFNAYLSHCSRFQLTDPWAFVPAEPHAFRGPADPAATVAKLAASYPEHALIEAGIAQRNATGLLTIHPFLSVPDTPVVAFATHSWAV